MLIFDKAPFPSCHASTLVEVSPGRFLAAWFGGKAEGAKDVQIWGSEFDGTKWTPPQVLASEPGQPCWNPVLFATHKHDLVLWYKAGPSPREWTGYSKRSTDSGKTWSKPEQLPAGFFGPVRAKPILTREGTIYAPTSLESYRAWTPFVDLSTDDGRSWSRSNACGVTDKPYGQIQPTLFQTADGGFAALMRSRDPRIICRAESKDGKTWTPAVPIGEPNPNSGIDCVKVKDLVYLIHNPSATLRTPLRVSKSTDDGKTFEKIKDLETEAGEYSYPAMILGSDGQLHMTYTWNRTHIKYEALAI